MFPFFESIRVLDGKVIALEFHQERVNNTLNHFKGTSLDLKNCLKEIVLPAKGLYKWRLQYGLDTFFCSEITPYVIKFSQSIKLVDASHINYEFKFQDRELINGLLQQSKAQDIIMCRQGLLTDSSYANLIFYNGSRWITPKSPLLLGTQRASLIKSGQVDLKDIRVADLNQIQFFKMVNAMVPFENAPTLKVKDLIFC